MAERRAISAVLKLFADSFSARAEARAVNGAYCATTSGVGANSAGPVAGAFFLATLLTGAFAAFAGADFLGAALWTTTLAATVFTAAFLTVAFLAATGSGFAAAALFAAHRFFVAAMIRFKPSSLMRRFAFGNSGTAATFLPLWNAAHRFFCAAAILALAVTLIIRFGAASVATTGPPKWLRISAIFCSILESSAW